jgi:hypothetical protein
VNNAVLRVADRGSVPCSTQPVDASCVLQAATYSQVPNSWFLLVVYALIFLFAESTFVVMVLKEWLQDILGLSDMDLIIGNKYEIIRTEVAPVTTELHDAGDAT